ncbi:MAG TPA: peptidoglycan-binding protein, partial [Candidatus Paceibacterota bacterium]|nr:peptidoglycan-binding protein [Candidatus Paceibacterota bacterium]
MTIASNNVVAKIAAVVAGLGLVAMAFAPAAKADTTSDLQAQIASLLAQIAALQAQLGTSTTGSTSMTFTMDLKVGSSGAQVTALQNWLISKGFTISAGATGFFGAQTKAALAAYQAANGISPAAGYFGPVTRARVNASAGGSTTTTTGGTTGGTTSTGPLSGGEGSIDNFKTIGATNTTLNQADSQQVLGFEFKADGSDLQVNRVDFDIVNNLSTGTLRPWGVFQTATLMDGNTTIGTVDLTNANNYSQDGFLSNGNQ